MRRWFALCLISLWLAGCRAPTNLDSLAALVIPAYRHQPPVPWAMDRVITRLRCSCGSTARSLQTVPSLGSAPTQLRTSQAPQQESWDSATRPNLNSGARTRHRAASRRCLPSATPGRPGPQSGMDTALREPADTVWHWPRRRPRLRWLRQLNFHRQFPAAPTVSSYGLIPPTNAPTRYASPVRPSAVRVGQGKRVVRPGPWRPTAYAMAPAAAPMGSTITYEIALHRRRHQLSIVPRWPAVPSAGYRVADDGWQPRLRR